MGATWQNILGTPTDIAIEGTNLVWLYPVPNDVLSLTFDVVRRTPIPLNDNDLVQIGREQLDMLIDYAEHLALFKVGGAEWMVTQRQADNFLQQSISYNRRISAAARYVITAKDQSQREQSVRPRELVADGLGALPSTQGADRG